MNCTSYGDQEKLLDYLSRFYPVAPFEKFARELSYIRTSPNNTISVRLTKETSIPSAIFCLNGVTQFVVYSSSFKEPNRFSRNVLRYASSLSQLIIENTSIGLLTADFGRFEHLKSLHLISVGLRSLPVSTRNLRLVESVDLSQNNLTELPAGWNSLSSLKYFTVSLNPRLTSLEPINGLPLLVELHAAHCSIRSLPRDLPRVSHLDLSDNQLGDLYGIETLGQENPNEKDFYLDRNKIRRIPLSIVKVRNLSRLILDSNYLVNIPQATPQCQFFKMHRFGLTIRSSPSELKRTSEAFSRAFNRSIIFSQQFPC